MVTIPIHDERERMIRSYPAFIARGVLAVLLGVLIFVVPKMAFMTLLVLFGVYAFVEGIVNIVAAFRRPRTAREPWWLLAIQGIASVAAGLLVFFLPDITALALLYVIAAWAAITGILEIVSAVRIRKYVKGEWLLGLAGVLSVLFGVLVAIFPGAGALAMILWIGAYALVFGVLQIVLGFRLRRVARGDHDEGAFPRPAPSH